MLKKDQYLDLYENLKIPRYIEERMLLLLRQGKLSKWFSGIGQEAISVGATLALNKKDVILPMHRNLGVFTSRKINYKKPFPQVELWYINTSYMVGPCIIKPRYKKKSNL